jgi:hypothetical protein
VRSADKHQRSSLLRAAHLRRIRAKAEDESRKVDEVSFINNLTTAGKKADLQQRLEDGKGHAKLPPDVICRAWTVACQCNVSNCVCMRLLHIRWHASVLMLCFFVCALSCVGEARRAEALAVILAKQQEAAANVREAAERRRAAEAERLAQLEHRQRRKEEVQVRVGYCTRKACTNCYYAHRNQNSNSCTPLTCLTRACRGWFCRLSWRRRGVPLWLRGRQLGHM